MKKNRFILALILISTIFLTVNHNLNAKNNKKNEVSTYKTITNITYKTVDNKNIKLDVYQPISAKQKTPAIIYFHGGSWISGNREKILQRYRSTALQRFTSEGYTVFSADYRLINFSNNHIDQAVEDCKDVVNHIVKHAIFYNIDTSKIGFWGSSAGAHLAMLAAMAPDSCLGQCSPQNDIIGKIKFIIDDFGPTNISEMFKTVNPRIRKHISDIFFDIPKAELNKFDSLTMQFSPSIYADKNKIPLLIFHGKNDKIVPFSQSESLYAQSDSICTSIYIFDGLGHGFNGMDTKNIKFYSDICIDFLKKIEN